MKLLDDLIELPRPLVESEECRSLGDDDKASLLRRLDKARMLGRDLMSGKRLAESADIAEFADDLELDVAILQELDSAWRGGLSRWLIHHSWSFKTSPPEMCNSLSAVMLSALDEREPRHDASMDEYCSWIGAIGRQLVQCTDELSNAKTYSSAIATHVVADILLARLLVGCYKLRLNRTMPR